MITFFNKKKTPEIIAFILATAIGFSSIAYADSSAYTAALSQDQSQGIPACCGVGSQVNQPYSINGGKPACPADQASNPSAYLAAIGAGNVQVSNQCYSTDSAVGSTPADVVNCTGGPNTGTQTCVTNYADGSIKQTNTTFGSIPGQGTITTTCTNASGQSVSSMPDCTASSNQGGTAVAATAAVTSTANAATKAITSPAANAAISAATNAALTVLDWVAYGIFALGAMFLGLAGVIFNWLIIITIFSFGKYFGNSAGLLTGWGIIRDIANIALLFGFIFLGTIIILDLPHAPDGRRAIPALLIFAVLLNFSLFAAEAVIDTTNALSASLYGQTAGQFDQCNGGSFSLTNCANAGPSGKILAAAGLTNIFTFTAPTSGGTQGSNFQTALTTISNDQIKGLIVYGLLATLVVIGAAVLFMGALMFFSRAIELVFLMLTSPIGFAGFAIPGLGGLARQWWDTLLRQAFFAPIYLLLLAISLAFVAGVQTILDVNSTLVAAITAPTTATSAVLVMFGLVIGFMIAALIIARKLGGSSAIITRTAVAGAAATAVGAGRFSRRIFSGGSRNKVSDSKSKERSDEKPRSTAGTTRAPLKNVANPAEEAREERTHARAPSTGNLKNVLAPSEKEKIEKENEQKAANDDSTTPRAANDNASTHQPIQEPTIPGRNQQPPEAANDALPPTKPKGPTTSGAAAIPLRPTPSNVTVVNSTEYQAKKAKAKETVEALKANALKDALDKTKNNTGAANAGTGANQVANTGAGASAAEIAEVVPLVV